jgi:hypothetical protein
MAQKRAAKANRRKAMLAEKRKAETVESSLAGRVRRAAAGPIRHCLLQHTSMAGAGMGTLIVTRELAPGQLAMAAFLLDTFARGIKDAFLRPIGAQEFDDQLKVLQSGGPFAEIAPADARKLLRDLRAWSASLGFAPHRDFAVVERVFGEVSTDASDAVFPFGNEGKPLLIEGAFDHPAEVERAIGRLEEARVPHSLPAPQIP